MERHSLSMEEEGLTSAEARARLSQYGLNRIKGRKGPSLFVLFLRQFFNPLVCILLIGVIVEILAHDFLDGIVLAGTLLIMAIIGFFQELRAERAMRELTRLYADTCKVKRDGNVVIIPSEQLVPGDLLYLEAGDIIPADANLLSTTNFRVNESTMTGESLPVEKKDLVLMGTTVTSGKATAICTNTGMNTELGKIAHAIQEIPSPKTPLQKSIHALSLWMTGCVFVVVAFFILISFYQGFDWVEVVLLSVSATIAGVPEGLPVAVTIVLATGMHVMTKRHAIIRHLSAVETLGSTTLICSDKTGTLTMNQMRVHELYLYRKRENDPRIQTMLEMGTLVNDAFLSNGKIVGDPTEGALLMAAEKAGVKKPALTKRGEIPFQSENLYMATLYDKLYVKGSPEKLLEFSTTLLTEKGVIPLREEERKEIQRELERMSSEALRLIAVAYGDTLENLTFVGVFGLIDPPREEAIAAVQSCKKAGIKVVMITGDNKTTAAAIAKQLGIADGGILTSDEIKSMSDEELMEKAKSVTVFARTRPLHKLRIVHAFQSLGHVVAMTGDGVNDAPALEAADIGVSMGIHGTDVAKEASDMVLSDDNFASVVAAVEEGRTIFTRLRNVCTFLLVASIGELLGLTLNVLFTGQASLTPLQILWINLFTGVIVTLPLAAEPKTGDELSHPPRDPRVKLIYPGMIYRILYLSILLGLSAFLIFSFTLSKTMTFTTIVIFEWLTAFNIRSTNKTIFQLGWLTNKSLMLAVIIGLICQIIIVRLTLLQWMIALIPGVIIFIIETIRKLFFPRLFSQGEWK